MSLPSTSIVHNKTLFGRGSDAGRPGEPAPATFTATINRELGKVEALLKVGFLFNGGCRVSPHHTPARARCAAVCPVLLSRPHLSKAAACCRVCDRGGEATWPFQMGVLGGVSLSSTPLHNPQIDAGPAVKLSWLIRVRLTLNPEDVVTAPRWWAPARTRCCRTLPRCCRAAAPPTSSASWSSRCSHVFRVPRITERAGVAVAAARRHCLAKSAAACSKQNVAKRQRQLDPAHFPCRNENPLFKHIFSWCNSPTW